MNIMAFLERVRMTQNELAEKLHVDQSAISLWNRNKTSPKKETQQALIKLGMRIDELFDDETWEFVKRNHEHDLQDLKNDTNLTNEQCKQIVKIGLSMLK